MQSCISGAGIPDTRYLSSPNFISFTLHCLTFLEIPVLSYGAYCIIYKTPSRMKSVKLLMLNLHFWSCLSDLVISCVGIPYILLPAPAGYGLGLLDSPQILVYLMVTFIAALTASVLAIYENRFYTLFAQNSWWKKVRKPFLFSIYALVPLIFLPPYFDLPEQESARQLVLSKIPCQPPFDFKHREIYVLALDYDVPVYCIAFGTVVLGVSITVFGWLIFHMLWFGTLSSSNSLRTLNMQRRFAISLTIQSTFMISVVLTPVLTILWIIFKWYHNQMLNNFIFITLSLHGVGSTIVMIFVHRPYREFTLSKLCYFSKKWRASVIEKRSGGTLNVVL